MRQVARSHLCYSKSAAISGTAAVALNAFRKPAGDLTPISPLRQTGHAHALAQPVAPSTYGRTVGKLSGAQATDGEVRI
jgi:hypothetical protein